MDLTPEPELPEIDDELVELAARGSAKKAGDNCFDDDRMALWYAKAQRRMYRDRARTVLEFAAPALREAAYRAGRAAATSEVCGVPRGLGVHTTLCEHEELREAALLRGEEAYRDKSGASWPVDCTRDQAIDLGRSTTGGPANTPTCRCYLVDVSIPGGGPEFRRGRSHDCPIHDDGKAEAARRRAREA